MHRLSAEETSNTVPSWPNSSISISNWTPMHLIIKPMVPSSKINPHRVYLIHVQVAFTHHSDTSHHLFKYEHVWSGFAADLRENKSMLLKFEEFIWIKLTIQNWIFVLKGNGLISWCTQYFTAWPDLTYTLLHRHKNVLQRWRRSAEMHKREEHLLVHHFTHPRPPVNTLTFMNTLNGIKEQNSKIMRRKNVGQHICFQRVCRGLVEWEVGGWESRPWAIITLSCDEQPDSKSAS